MKTLIFILFVCSLGLSAQHSHGSHSQYCELPAMTCTNNTVHEITLPNYVNAKANPQPWTTETIHQGKIADPLEVVIMLDRATVNDLSALRDVAYQCVDFYLQTDGVAGYEDWYTFKIIYSIDTYLPTYVNNYNFYADANTFAPNHDLILIMKNDSAYGGGASSDYAWFALDWAPEVFRHELGHILAEATNGVIRRATDEYVVRYDSTTIGTPTGYNLDSVGYSSIQFEPFIDAGYQTVYGYGGWGRGYILGSLTYMYALNKSGGIIMPNYNINVIHEVTPNIILSKSPVNAVVSVSGLGQTLSVDAIDCATCAFKWYVNDTLVQSGKDSNYVQMYAGNNPVSVRVEIIDTNELIVDTRWIKKNWSRSWTVIPDSTVLPQTSLERFNVKRNEPNNGVIVNWETGIEYENNGFNLFVDDSLIGFIPSQGNTLDGYAYQVQFPADCDSSYDIRLEKMDAIDTSRHTISVEMRECQTVSIANAGDMVTRMYPNPTKGVVYVEFASQVQHIILTDMVGKIQRKINISNMNAQVSLEQFQPGIYFITIIDQNNTSITKKIIKK